MIVDKDGCKFEIEWTDHPGYPIMEEMAITATRAFKERDKKYNPLLAALLKRALVDKDGKPFTSEPKGFAWDVYDDKELK